MTDKTPSTTNHDDDTSVLGKILPWTQNKVPIDSTKDIKHESPVTQTGNGNIPHPPINTQERLMERDVELKQKPLEEPRPLGEKMTVKDSDLQAAMSDVPKKRVSVLEMWNLIESVGIKREAVEKIFTTDESVMELYRVIEKRIHYQREQDMIMRLKAYIEKIKKDEFGQSKPKSTS
ncbi:MAG TPA: hypothetical protein VJ792_00750 [Candidatus Nitrosotalea sp.]|nr:hypothetical protein [Candidatus Nitrosotalea sp.]